MGGTYLLPDVVGEAHARDLLLTGRVVDADEALRLGPGLAGHDAGRVPRRGARDRRRDRRRPRRSPAGSPSSRWPTAGTATSRPPAVGGAGPAGHAGHRGPAGGHPRAAEKRAGEAARRSFTGAADLDAGPAAGRGAPSRMPVDSTCGKVAGTRGSSAPTQEAIRRVNAVDPPLWTSLWTRDERSPVDQQGMAVSHGLWRERLTSTMWSHGVWTPPTGRQE